MSNQIKQYSPITQGRSPAKFERARQLRKSMTAAERRLWHVLKTEQLDGLHFRRQQTVVGFIVDFYCHRLRLGIELDGSSHNDTAEYDAARDTIMAEQGVSIIRFSNEQIFHALDCVTEQIAQIAFRRDTYRKA